MDKILYKDNKFELAYNENGMYFISGCNRYELLCHPYEPIIYIKESDGSVDIVIHNSFILSSLKISLVFTNCSNSIFAFFRLPFLI